MKKSGYLMIECLVYIGVLFVLMSIGYIVMDRCIQNSARLRRNAEDVANALRAGERWRAEMRASGTSARVEQYDSYAVLRLTTGGRDIAYLFQNNSVLRSAAGAPWVPILKRVKASVMEPDRRQNVLAWSWELELQGDPKPGRVRPLFTFLAVPQQTAAK